jgi:hypothetical protein
MLCFRLYRSPNISPSPRILNISFILQKYQFFRCHKFTFDTKKLLYNNSLSVDGAKIEDVLGNRFKYNVPKVTEEEVIQAFEEVGAFPKGIV